MRRKQSTSLESSSAKCVPGHSRANLRVTAFCFLAKDRITAEIEHGPSFLNGFPIGERHTLVIPERRVVNLFDLTSAGASALWEFVARMRSSLAARVQPDAFNIGVNGGVAAG